MSGENPLDWVYTTCNVLSESNLRNFDGWLDFISASESQILIDDAMNFRISAVCEKVSQKESQKAAYIIYVLTVIKKHEPINVSQIIEKSRLSSNSINRTLKILLEKQIIRFTQKKSKKNNEKIFSINKNLEKKYIMNLLLWKGLPDAIRISKQMKRKMKYDSLVNQHTRKLYDIVIRSYNGKEPTSEKSVRIPLFTSHERNRIEHGLASEEFIKVGNLFIPRDLIQSEYELTPNKSVMIGDLPRRIAQRILRDFSDGAYCYDCFLEGHIRKWAYHKGENFCPKCLRHQPTEHLPIIRQKRFKRKHLKEKN